MSKGHETPRSLVLIEDDADAGMLLALLLERLGYDVSLASDAPSGLALILEVDPDVAIVDIDLPELSGFEIGAHVREARGVTRPKMIALTGYGTAEIRQRAQAAGYDCHFLEPIDLRELESTLRAFERE